MAYAYYTTARMTAAASAYLRTSVKVTMSAAPSMGFLTLAPVTVTFATPVGVSLRARLLPQTLRANVALGVSLTYTEPTDTRESYTALIIASGSRLSIRDTVLELEPRQRTTKRANEEFGTVTYHTRVFSCPEGKTTQTALNSILALGAHMRKAWSDEYYSLKLDGPKIANVSAQFHPGTALNRITATFIEIHLPAPVATGYNETLRLHPAAEQVGGDVVVIWGITNKRDGTNVPDIDDRLDEALGLTAYSCRNIEYFDNRLPGRLLMRTTWGRRLADDPIIGATDASG